MEQCDCSEDHFNPQHMSEKNPRKEATLRGLKLPNGSKKSLERHSRGFPR